MKEIKHIPWPDIRQFHQVRRDVQHKAQFKELDETGEPIMDRLAHMPVLKYEGTIKTHGSNCSVQFHRDGTTVYQSRERIITPDDDCYGFARYMDSIKDCELFKSWKELFFPPETLNPNYDLVDVVTIYGEWIGPGIQKGVAISEIPHKSWIIFGGRYGEGEDATSFNIEGLPGSSTNNIYNINSFPKYNIDIDFENPGLMINQMNEWTLEVEKECPVGKYFDISGIGEGIVFKCIEPGWESSKFTFKVKGSEHSKSKVTKLATVDIEKVNSIKEFVSTVLDESRLQQGISKLLENNKPIVEQHTGDFLRWIVNDIIKENKEQMQQCGIEEKEVGKVVNVEARRWYLNKCKEI